jgi:hypothetical protein
MRKIILALLIALAPSLACAQNVSTVTITSGVPTAGSGTVSTLDNLIGTAGTAKSNVLTVQGISAMTPFLVAQSGTWNVTNVSGTISLPTGAATSANQTTANSSLATLVTNSAAAIPAGTNPIGYLTGQYPGGATPITGNSTGTTGAVVGTLAGTSAKTTYICGFDVSALGGTATVGPIVVAGLITSSATYQFSSTAAGSTFSRSFNPCIPAIAVNTPITITTTADGTASAVDVNSFGYEL